jgi:hypothetical protein
MKKLTSLLFLTVTLSAMATSAVAATITLDAAFRGGYRSSGANNGTSPGNNYVAGECLTIGTIFCGVAPGVPETRNWFEFNLSSVSSPVTAATLLLQEPGGVGFGSSISPTLTYTLYDISASDAAALGGVSTAIFADLGSGTSFGSYVASSADNNANETVAISLNAAALSLINANLGSSFALGGAITPLNGIDDTAYLFGFTSQFESTRLQLTTQDASTPVPEPGTIVLVGSAFALLTARKKRVLTPGSGRSVPGGQ